MIQRTASMSFNDVAGKKYTLSIKDVKEDVEDAKVLALMDNIINNNLIKTENGALIQKKAAQVVVKDTTEIEL